MIKKQTRNYTIDLFKFFAALLVIGIHTGPFTEVSEDLYFFVVNILCRLAVPFFAVCSGYFVSNSIVRNDGRFSCVGKQETKLIKLYIVWTLLYFLFDIPFAIHGGWFTIKNYVGYAISAVTTGSHYHLWYLISLIYALPLFFLCVKYLKKKAVLPVMILLYVVKALSYGYTKWLPKPINDVFGICQKFSALFDAIFLLLPLLLLGYIISNSKAPKLMWCIIGFVCSFSLLTVEAFVLRSIGQDSVSYVFMTLPTAYFGFASVSQMRVGSNLRIGKMLGSISLFIYCFHPMAVEILPKDMYSLIKYLITAAVSIAIAVGYYYLKRYIQKIKHHY